MKTTYRMKASITDAYNTILDSTIAEVGLYSGKKITAENLANGYKYHRRVKEKGRDVDVVVHIRKPQPLKNINIMSAYPDQSYELNYNFEKLDDKHTLITYEQINSRNKDKKAGPLFKWGMRRRFKQMEKYIRRAKREL